MNSGSQRSQTRTALTVAALLVMALAVSLRLVALGKGGFWLDEVFSASFANLSAVGTVLAVFLHDVHPPLYYLQLNAWGQLGHGDYWLLLNSVFWSTLTLIAVYFGVRAQFGAGAALLSLAFCGVLGSEIYFGQQLRMYAMYSCLAVLSWICARRVFADYRFSRAVPLILVLALMGAVHSASLIGASAALLFVLPLGVVKPSRQRLLTWCAIGLVVMCAFAPWVINSTYRHVGHPQPVSILVASQTVGGWLIGYGNALPAWGAPAASVLVLAALALSITVLPELRRLVLCYIVWPLAFGALLCIAVEPIWLERTFAFCAPFLGIALGSAASRWLARASVHESHIAAVWRASLIGLAIAALAVADYRQATTPYKLDQFRDLAQYLDREAKPGELIFANEGVSLWGISRYLLGPDWGDILKVYDLNDLEHLKKWQRLESLLGLATLTKLGAVPTTRRVDGFRVPMFIGYSPLADLGQASAVWLVTDGTPPHDLAPCADPNSYPAPLEFGRLRLYHVPCAHGA